MNSDFQLIELENRGDERGDMFNLFQNQLQYLPKIAEIHFGSVKPGALRGNHYHENRKEVLTVYYEDGVELAWRHGRDQEVGQKEFTGKGAVTMLIPENCTHTIFNSGTKAVVLMSASNVSFDKDAPDTYRDKLINRI